MNWDIVKNFNPLTDHFLTAAFNTVFFWALALLLMAISWFVMDKIMFRSIKFHDELQKGNTAVALVVAAFFLAIGLIIFGITN